MEQILPDIPRVYTAIAEFLACFTYVALYQKKINTYQYIGGIFALIVQICLQVIAGQLPIEYWLGMMIANLGWMYLTLRLLVPVDAKFCGYLSLKSFVIAEFAAALAWQIYSFFIWPNIALGTLFVFGIIGIFYGLIYLIIYRIERQITGEVTVESIENRELGIICLIVIIVFTMSNIGFLLTNTAFNFGNFTALYSMRTLVNFAGLCIIFLLQIQKHDRQLKDELDKISNVLSSKQYEKYISYKENSELIQQKMHDLKHQIHIIKNEENQDRRNTHIDVVLEELNHMSANIETGNQVLDTILTNKNIYCIENKIIFSCIADGKLLNFMDVSDICSIFGNAFDNAIEHIAGKNIEKSIINLRIVEKGNFVVIRFENYCDSRQPLIDGIPLTTKVDKVNHGYGIKSIRYTVSKYGGTTTVEYKDSWFYLKILIPKTANLPLSV